MTIALISIRNEYVDKILDGSKKYEFRVWAFANKPSTIVIYVSRNPVKDIVGYFEFNRVEIDKPSVLWEHFKEQSGMNKQAFYEHFEGYDILYAIEIINLQILKRDVKLSSISKTRKIHPPEKWTELSEEEFEEIKRAS